MKYKLYLLFVVVFSLCVGSGYAQIITTVAGNDSVNYCCDGSAAVNAGLYNPSSIFIDALNNIYIADRNNNRIRKVDASGIITTIAGTGTAAFSGDNGFATAAELNYPYGIALDLSGNVYFSDDGNHCIRKINTSGIITTIAGKGTLGFSGDNGSATMAELNDPGGIAVDSVGNVYVADYQNYRIRKISTSGIITTIAGSGVPGYSGDNGPATSAKLFLPEQLAFDRYGNLYIADYGNHCVRKVDNSGIITTIAGTGAPGFSGDGGSATSAQLNHPSGVAIDIAGNVFISDFGNVRVREINNSGILNTIAGNGLSGFSGDGSLAVLARFGGPSGMSLDVVGNLYIADLPNNRIRYIRNTAATPGIEKSDNSIKVYPNPCSGKFTIRTQLTTTQDVKITITDMLGRNVKEITAYSADPVDVDISELPVGVYVVKVGGEGWQVVTKVVKE